MKNILYVLISGLFWGCSGSSADQNLQNEAYNVLIIMVDDQDAQMNELMHDQVKTPAFKKLAGEGFLFTNAYCAVPACAPSRTALLTGVAAHNSGAYYNNQNLWKTNSPLINIRNLPAYFKQNGYLAAGYGKIFHPGHDTYNLEDWSKGYYEGLSVTQSNNLKHYVNERVKVFSDMWSIGKLPNDWDLNDTSKMQQDTHNALKTIEILEKQQDHPFFIALGIYRPHVPYYAPKRYFDLYPVDSIEIPEDFLANDLKDVPACAQWVATNRGFHQDITERGLWKQLLQAKMASITYSDDQIGRVIEALDQGPNKENTIVIFIGDNGFHTGQKNHWSKFALWEKATQVPMIVRMPGQSAAVNISSPVSLLDIYPTLVELCNFQVPEHNLDGVSLAPILLNESSERGAPVLVSHGRENHAVVAEDFYYIHYRNGAEELYDQQNDPFQWQNLANKQEFSDQIIELRKYLPKSNKANLPFDYGDEASKGWDPKVFE